MPETARTNVKEDKALEKSRKVRVWRWLRRGALALVALVLIVVLLGWIFLPRIAERVIREMIADAGLNQSELRVVDVGWRSAVLEGVALQGDTWSFSAKRIHINYDPPDLVNGRIQDVDIEGMVATLDMESDQELVGPSREGETSSPVEGDQGMAWLHQLPVQLEKVGAIRAQNANVLLIRGESQFSQTLSLQMDQSSYGKLSGAIMTSHSGLNFSVQSSGDTSEIKLTAKEVKPVPFVEMIEFLLGVDEPFIPQGITLKGAELGGGMTVTGDVMSPLEVTGTLTGVAYDGGEKPIQMKSDLVVMKLRADFTGVGSIQFAGNAGELLLPLDPSADFELGLAKESRPRWSVKISWGDDPAVMTGEMQKLGLIGKYDGKPITFSDVGLSVEMKEQKLSVGGSLTHAGTVIPLRYSHALKELPDDRWSMVGNVMLGPVQHTRSLPVLVAVTDLFEDIQIEGRSETSMEFSVGSHEPFRGKMSTRLTDAKVDAAEGKVKASGVNGTWELHILPLPDASPDTEDPSFYTLHFSAQKLMIASKDALDYDLVHEAEKPVVVTGKGHFGMDASELVGEIKDLHLYGEKKGHELILANMGIQYRMKGDVLNAEGKMSIDENEIPFKYWHERKSNGDAWDLAGWLKIEHAQLKNPVTSGVMFVEAMEGKTLTGNAAMKMSFSLGSEKDFDGVLAAALTDGTLTFEDDGPVLEGLRGDIRLSSMKQKKTDGFHRVTAKKVKAFDMEMSNLRLDYQILPNGDIPLRNIALNALGGVVWVDPFVMPGGDDNYQFKIRMKKLDLAKLAKLFPDFNGSINGRIDGLLPMQYIGGEFRPVRGGMYLTPRSRAKLRYDAGNKFSGGLNPKGREYQQMKMVEDSLKNLELKVLSIRLFDPKDKDKAVVLRLQGRAPTVPGSPPIILNVNGFKPDDDTIDFFDLLLKHRDKLNFGL